MRRASASAEALPLNPLNWNQMKKRYTLEQKHWDSPAIYAMPEHTRVPASFTVGNVRIAPATVLAPMAASQTPSSAASSRTPASSLPPPKRVPHVSTLRRGFQTSKPPPPTSSPAAASS